MSNLTTVFQQAFRAVESETASATAELQFAPDCFFFAGHFPGQPVLPAVVQVASAIELASRLLGSPQCLAEVTRAKFTNPTGPGRLLRLAVSVEAEDGGRHKVRATLTEGDLLVSELVLRVTPEPVVAR